EVLQLEQISEKLPGAVSNNHRVGRRDRLQPRGQVWGLTYNASLLRVARPDQVSDDHDSGRYADADLQKNRRPEGGYRCDQLQSGPYGALRIILVSLGIAEIDENPVAHVFRHEAAETRHRLRDAFVEGRNDVSQILGVHACRELRRAHEVGEHNR